mgnify:CR=1 FL=1
MLTIRFTYPLVDREYSYQTKLATLGDEEAHKILREASITGREGFFCLVSNKDSIEKIMNSLKNEIEIRPLRVWSEHSIYGALILGFVAQLIISLLRFGHKELKHTSPKFIKISLQNLTVTVEYIKPEEKRFIYSNFSQISEVILGQNEAIT